MTLSIAIAIYRVDFPGIRSSLRFAINTVQHVTFDFQYKFLPGIPKKGAGLI